MNNYTLDKSIKLIYAALWLQFDHKLACMNAALLLLAPWLYFIPQCDPVGFGCGLSGDRAHPGEQGPKDA